MKFTLGKVGSTGGCCVQAIPPNTNPATAKTLLSVTVSTKDLPNELFELRDNTDKQRRASMDFPCECNYYFLLFFATVIFYGVNQSLIQQAKFLL